MTALKSNKIFPNVCRKIKTRRIKIYPDDDKNFYFQLFIHTLDIQHKPLNQMWIKLVRHRKKCRKTYANVLECDLLYPQHFCSSFYIFVCLGYATSFYIWV